MSAAFILLALSAATGFTIATSFSWFAILISSTALAAQGSRLSQNCDHRYLFDPAPARLRCGSGPCAPCFGGSQEITRASRQDWRSEGLAPLILASSTTNQAKIAPKRRRYQENRECSWAK